MNAPIARQRFTNNTDLPLALAVFLASDLYDYIPDPYTISATTLLKPLRQIILASRVPPDLSLVDIQDQVAVRLGSAIHDGIERSWKNEQRRTKALQEMGLPQHIIERIVVNPPAEYLLAHPEAIPVYMEQRLTKKVGKWTVTGKFDFVADGIVQDFKTATVFSYMKQRNAEKQIKQGSIYRWLDPKLITKDQMIILHMFLDWSRALTVDPNYPQSRTLKQVLDLMSVAETDHFVQNKLSLLDQYWDAPEDQIPECDADELWRSDPVFKYYKNGAANQKRSTKNFDTRAEAYTYLAQTNGVGELKEIPGTVKACLYCNAFPVCGQKDKLIAAGDLDVGQ